MQCGRDKSGSHDKSGSYGCLWKASLPSGKQISLDGSTAYVACSARCIIKRICGCAIFGQSHKSHSLIIAHERPGLCCAFSFYKVPVSLAALGRLSWILCVVPVSVA